VQAFLQERTLQLQQRIRDYERKKKRYKITVYDTGKAIIEDTFEKRSASIDIYDTRFFYFVDKLNEYEEALNYV